MFNSIEEQINILNSIIEACVNHGGDVGGAYFSNAEEVEEAINLWLEKIDLSERYKVITKEAKGKDFPVHECYPKIVPIDYDITHSKG